jgi:hypothetical protein
MIHPKSELPNRDFYASRPEVVSGLLHLGLRGTATPIIERLRSKDGETWLLSSLRQVLGSPGDAPERWLLDPETPSDRLSELKDKAKGVFRTAEKGGDGEGSLRARLGYFLTIAANLAHHGVLDSGQPAENVRDALLDLAGALPPPWDDLVVKGLDHLV